MIRDELRRLLEAVNQLEAQEDDKDKGYASYYKAAEAEVVDVAIELTAYIRELLGVSATVDEVAFERRRGGGVVIEESYRVSMRALLDDRARTYLRAQMRRRVIDQLAEKTGLPFHLAIVAIERWQETEVDPEPEENWRRPVAERSVALVTRCEVRAVEYPVEAGEGADGAAASGTGGGDADRGDALAGAD